MPILPTHHATLFQHAVDQAAAELKQGGVVALPTETVYGLAANALDAEAVRRIFALKGRPSHNPVIVHVHGLTMARRCTAEWPKAADRLAEAFWPGPLTLVLRRAPGIPEVVTAGGDTVGVRWPSHPIMQAVIEACGFPLAAPSANPSNGLSPTQPEHVSAMMGDRVSVILDGGQCQVGIESTVLDLTQEPPRLLRPGIIGATELAAVLGTRPSVSESVTDATLRSPGQLPKHYAPKAKLLLLRWTKASELIAALERRGEDPGGWHVLAHQHIPTQGPFARVSVIPHDAEAYARALYAELHTCDALGARGVVVEALPEGDAWNAIRDRLHRAMTQ